MAETRSALVEAATELFDRKGFAETTVEEICERADVAQRTFFRYFPSKEAVLYAEFEDLQAQLLARLAERPADEAPLAALHQALRGHATVVQTRFEALARLAKRAEECRGSGAEKAVLRQQMTEAVAAALAARLGTDPAVDPRPTAWAGLMISCFGAAMRAAMHGDGDLVARFDELLAGTAAELASLPAAD